MTDQRYGIFEIAKDDAPVGGPYFTGPLDECLACLSMAELNEKLFETNEQLSAREQALNAREQTFNEQSTQLAHKLADSGTRIVDTFEKQRALSMKRAHAEQQKRDRARVERYLDEELPDPDQPNLYSIDPAERHASMRDQATEGIPPPADPAGAALKDAGLGEEVTTTERTADPADLGHAPNPKQIAPPVAASFW
jgi:hypothetical protein